MAWPHLTDAQTLRLQRRKPAYILSAFALTWQPALQSHATPGKALCISNASLSQKPFTQCTLPYTTLEPRLHTKWHNQSILHEITFHILHVCIEKLRTLSSMTPAAQEKRLEIIFTPELQS